MVLIALIALLAFIALTRNRKFLSQDNRAREKKVLNPKLGEISQVEDRRSTIGVTFSNWGFSFSSFECASNWIYWDKHHEYILIFTLFELLGEEHLSSNCIPWNFSYYWYSPSN